LLARPSKGCWRESDDRRAKGCSRGRKLKSCRPPATAGARPSRRLPRAAGGEGREGWH
jgi:hypothetical protein